MITENNKVFRLTTERTSYIFTITKYVYRKIKPVIISVDIKYAKLKDIISDIDVNNK